MIKIKMRKPKPLPEPDWSLLIEQCQDYIDYLEKYGHPPKDGRVYIYEQAMTAVFGRTVWNWIHEVDES